MALASGTIPANDESTTIVYATFALLPSASQTGDEAWLANSWVPSGKTRMIYDGAKWRPRPGELLARERSADGTAIISSTAATLGLSVGVFGQAYQSAVLPAWMLRVGGVYRATASINATQSAGGEIFYGGAGISSSAISNSDSCLFGVQSTRSANPKSYLSASKMFRIAGSSLLADSTGKSVGTHSDSPTTVGAFVADSMRFRVGYQCVAGSDVVSVYGWELWEGP